MVTVIVLIWIFYSVWENYPFDLGRYIRAKVHNDFLLLIAHRIGCCSLGVYPIDIRRNGIFAFQCSLRWRMMNHAVFVLSHPRTFKFLRNSSPCHFKKCRHIKRLAAFGTKNRFFPHNTFFSAFSQLTTFRAKERKHVQSTIFFFFLSYPRGGRYWKL